jgi:hypothetical protein
MNSYRMVPKTLIIDDAGVSPHGQPFSLQDALVYTIEHQIPLEIAQITAIVISRWGHVRTTARPFDYTINGSNNTIKQRHLQNCQKTAKHGRRHSRY